MGLDVAVRIGRHERGSNDHAAVVDPEAGAITAPKGPKVAHHTPRPQHRMSDREAVRVEADHRLTGNSTAFVNVLRQTPTLAGKRFQVLHAGAPRPDKGVVLARRRLTLANDLTRVVHAVCGAEGPAQRAQVRHRSTGKRESVVVSGRILRVTDHLSAVAHVVCYAVAAAESSEIANRRLSRN